MPEDYTVWMYPYMTRLLRTIDSVFLILERLPEREGMILDSDVRELQYCAEALGLEIPDGMNLYDPKVFTIIKGRVMNALLQKLEELKPSPVGLNPEFPEYGPIREGGEGKQPRRGGEKR